ncbi:MAG: heavy metal translocating P-type ATPase [Myxococcota bacterium]
MAAALAGQSMVVSLVVNLGEVPAPERHFFHIALASVTLLVFELVGRPLWRGVRQAVVERAARFELLFAAGVAGALGVSVAGLFDAGGHVYFEVAQILAVLFAVGHRINTEGRARAMRELRELVSEDASCDVRSCCGAVRRVPLGEVRAGQVVVVPPGGRIPVDGVAVAQEALVREAAITGEPFVVVRQPGDRVHAGAHVLDGTMDVRATAGLGGRVIDQIAGAIEEAWAHPGRLQRLADRATRAFLPLVLTVAFAVLVGWGVASGWWTGVLHAMAVLLVACPCAMGFATPLATWGAMGVLGRRGIVLRGAEAVERLAGVDRVAVDKTGTLTSAEPRLLDLVFVPRAPYDGATMRKLVATVEAATDHPLAAALRNAAAPGPPFSVHAVRILPGRGVEAEVEDRTTGRRLRVRIGAPLLADEEGLAEERRSLEARLHAPAGAHRLAILVDAGLCGMAAVDEQVLDGVPSMLREFAALGLAPEVLTGDADAARLSRVAATRACGGLSPEAKRRRIEALRAQGHRVLYLGDGINDGAAMAAAHLALAPEGASDLAREVAHGVWRGVDPRHVPWAIGVARAAVDTIRSNLRFAAAYNTVAIAVAAAGWLHPVFAATIMVASSLFVTWRSGSYAARMVRADGLPEPHLQAGAA